MTDAHEDPQAATEIGQPRPITDVTSERLKPVLGRLFPTIMGDGVKLHILDQSVIPAMQTRVEAMETESTLLNPGIAATPAPETL